jgi:hypothetical protein
MRVDRLKGAAEKAVPFWQDGQLQVALPKDLGDAVIRLRVEIGGVAWPEAATQQLKLREVSRKEQLLQELAALQYEGLLLRQARAGGQGAGAGLPPPQRAIDQLYTVTGIQGVKGALEGAHMLCCSAQVVDMSSDSGSDGEGGQITQQDFWELTVRATWSGQQVCICRGEVVASIGQHSCLLQPCHVMGVICVCPSAHREVLMHPHMVCIAQSIC